MASRTSVFLVLPVSLCSSFSRVAWESKMKMSLYRPFFMVMLRYPLSFNIYSGVVRSGSVL